MADPYAIGEVGIELVIDQINNEPDLTRKHKIAYHAAFDAIDELHEYGIKTVGQYASIVVEQQFGKIDWSDPIWLEI